MTRSRWPVAVLTVFLAAGTLKASPLLAGLPVDLTGFCAALLALTALNAMLGAVVHRVAVGGAWIFGALVVWAIGAIDEPRTEYAAQKGITLLVLTLGCAFVGALLLVRTQTQRRWLIDGTVVVGVVVVVLYLIAPTSNAALEGRAAIEGSNTIAPGRYTGAALVALLTMMAVKRVRWWVALVPLLGTAGLLWATGSRGPLVAVAVSMLVVMPLVLSSRHRARALLVAALAGGLAMYYFAHSTAQVQDRLSVLLANDKGQSVYERLYMWSTTWQVFQDSPTGVGWGGLAPDLYPIARYPHDLVLEMAAEGGVVALLALAVVVVVAYMRGFRNARSGDWTALALVALLTFWLTNALVSGDLNDNRGVFLFAGACIALGRCPAAASESDGDDFDARIEVGGVGVMPIRQGM